MIKLNSNYIKNFVTEEEIKGYQPMVDAVDKVIRTRSGAGGHMTDWVDLPVNYDKEEYAKIVKCAKDIREKCDVFIVIGIGGSYLGARAVVEFVNSQLYNELPANSPKVYFCGRDISAENRNIHFMNVTTEYFAITGLNMPKYNEKLRLFRNIRKMPDSLLSETPESLEFVKMRNMIPQRLIRTPPAFFHVRGSLSTYAAMNIVYIGDIELIIEQCIGVTSGIATRKVSCVTK